jgi:Stage II sporulation protein E (SpoIIE)
LVQIQPPQPNLFIHKGFRGGPPEALLLFGKDLGKHFTRYPAALVRLQLAPVLISSFRLREVEGFSATETVEALGIHSAGRCVGAINSEACTNQDGTKDVRTVWISDDVLVAYTDGITEAENRQPKLWGRPTLEALLKSCSHYRRRQQATPGTIHLMDASAFVGTDSKVDYFRLARHPLEEDSQRLSDPLIAQQAQAKTSTLSRCTSGGPGGRAVCSSGWRCRPQSPSPMESVRDEED